jgi:histidinol-phosphatase (PHP family)
VQEGFETEESLVKLFDDYMVEAIRMRDRYSDKIHILIGFESEWIRPATEAIVCGLLDRYAGTLDLFMGSLHHVHTFPIDYDQNTYEAARTRAGGTDERLFEDYFDSQLQMLQTFKPPIVGHFDLIRLKSDDADTEFQGMKGVWERVKRNLEFISSYGGILELNSAALRKGLSQPYPCLSICQVCYTAIDTYR